MSTLNNPPGLSALLVALHFYANPENWKQEQTGIGAFPGAAESDNGAKAAEALTFFRNRPAPTCKNCAWWGRETDGVCDAPQSDLVKTLRKVHGYPETVYGTTEPDGFTIHATAADDTNLSAELVTGPEFGCVRFTLRCPVCSGKGYTVDPRGFVSGRCATCDGTGKAVP